MKVKFFYSQMLNYGDFHLFINSFWFGLILSVSEKATYQHNIKKAKFKRINIFKCEGQVQGHRT